MSSAEATLKLALVGNPNAGKSALFNQLTGARQKVANYPGVTVERRSGVFSTPSGVDVELVDLPGTYSLTPHSADERITRDVITGQMDTEAQPDGILCVIDATNLRQHLRFVLELKRLGRPVIVALNMMDLAKRDRIEIDVAALEDKLGVPVVPTVAVRKSGVEALTEQLSLDSWRDASAGPVPTDADVRALQQEARSIARDVIMSEGIQHALSRRLDSIVLHPVIGPVILLSILFVMFQAVFSWAAWPMDQIDAGAVALQQLTVGALGDGLLASLIADGIIAGVGSVVIFLPQILILFAFIIALELSGYLTRAAFLMDRLMSSVGLNGRSFIPLLSSFACAIPGIMAARTIDNERDRLTTILIAPLMTCSARLPVYTLIIAAMIPPTTVAGGIGLQGLVMFGLYLAGIVSALIVAWVLKRTVTQGAPQPLLLVMPNYQVPSFKFLLSGLYERARIFIARAGRIILPLMVILWVLSTFPGAPADAEGPAILYSFAGMIGKALSFIFAPIGFGWEICIALVPGMAAREVAVAALGTVYALSGSEEAVASSLATTLQTAWSLPTALAFLAWYVYAPQCLATLAVAKRETNSAKWAWFMAAYLFGLAYVAAGLTYWIATWLS